MQRIWVFKDYQERDKVYEMEDLLWWICKGRGGSFIKIRESGGFVREDHIVYQPKGYSIFEVTPPPDTKNHSWGIKGGGESKPYL